MTTPETNVPDEPRRRAPREDFRHARAALTLVQPIHHQIGPWQASAARLLGIGERLQANGEHSSSHAAEAEALILAVEEQRRRVAIEMQLLPTKVAGNGRILDTLCALDSVASALQRASKLLGDSSPRE